MTLCSFFKDLDLLSNAVFTVKSECRNVLIHSQFPENLLLQQLFTWNIEAQYNWIFLDA